MKNIVKITDTEYILSKKKYSQIFYGEVQLKQGHALVGITDDKLCALYMIEDESMIALTRVLQRQWKYSSVLLNQQLVDSFKEQLISFENTGDFSIDVILKGTPFQTQVWEKLLEIPRGETRSYQDIADVMTDSSARAIGGAVSRNEISLIFPCHRVIHNNGDIGNYRWGRKCKARLIRLEKGDYDDGFFPEF